ncbi:MAG: hypothetical protein JW874_08545 [Spirochaetales bacterium]|nr:hypothetical protein [Spirochaetales bacterium]
MKKKGHKALWIFPLCRNLAVFALALAVFLSCEAEESTDPIEEALGIWENQLEEYSPSAYEYLYLNDDGSFVQYFCFVTEGTDGPEYIFLADNHSGKGEYTNSDTSLTIEVQYSTFDPDGTVNDGWGEPIDPYVQYSGEFLVSGDTLTMYVDLNDDDDYDDEREEIEYQRVSEIDVDGDGSYTD